MISNILKSKSLFIVLGLFVMIALVFLLGARLKLGLAWRLLIILALLFTIVIIYMYKRFEAERSAESIEQSIGKFGMHPGQEEEIAQLRKKLVDAIDSLKHSDLAKGVDGKSALYALPWYMFIGPPGAGKTTAIENSGLEFPQGTDRIQGIGGTRNCDWFFSNSAIFLDTAGRYTTEEEDKEEWHAFLDILKKYRRKRPINGVLIGFSITEIMQASSDDLESAALIIRNRIDELIDRLSIKFPVYLLFTKCDLIQGFVEFFENFGKSDREQIWGTTFTKEQQANPDHTGIFYEEFQKLSDVLFSLRIDRLNNPMNRLTRQRVFTFPIEFSMLREQLGTFINKLFRQNPYRENPKFRGFYFTSGTQEGIPIERVIQAITEQFQLYQQPEKVQQLSEKTKSYFIKNLFTEVVIPDRHLVVKTSNWLKKQGWLKLASVMVALVLIGVVFIWSASVYSNFRVDAMNYRDAFLATDNLNFISLKNSARVEIHEEIENNFRKLDDYWNKIIELEHPPLFHAGIYHNNQSIITAGKRDYYAKLQPYIQKNLFQNILVSKLKEYTRNPSGMPRDEALKFLRGYLLLTEEGERIANSSLEQNFMKEEIVPLMKSFSGDTIQIGEHNIDSLIISLQVDRYFQILPALYSKTGYNEQFFFKPDSILVKRTRALIGKPDFDYVYSMVKRKGLIKSQDKSISLNSIVSRLGSSIFITNPTVEGYYTWNGWTDDVKKEIERSSHSLPDLLWVFGLESNDLPDNLNDTNQLIQDLKSRYFKEYTDVWRNFLYQIKYHPSLGENEIEKLGDLSDSPLKKIIASVENNVDAVQAKDSTNSSFIQNFARKIGFLNQDSDANERISDPLTALSHDEETLTNLLKQYQQLAEIMESNKRPSESYNFTTGVLTEDGGNLAAILKEIQEATAKVKSDLRSTLFEAPVLIVWNGLQSRTKMYLDNLWKNEVYNKFRDIADRYPFSKKSDKEVKLEDFTEFFNKDSGTLWSFVNEKLHLFVNDSYQAKTWRGSGINIPANKRNIFRKAESITKGMGLDRSNKISISFDLVASSPDPRGNESNVKEIQININGKRFPYQMTGLNRESFVWPGESKEGANLRLIPYKNQPPLYPVKEIGGIWGFFRLLDGGAQKSQISDHFNLVWVFESDHGQKVKIQYDLIPSSNNNPFGDGFFDLGPPPKSLF